MKKQISGKYNIKKHILLMCPDCGRMKIVKREEIDYPDAIFIQVQDNCNDDFETVEYYGTDGQIDRDPELSAGQLQIARDSDLKRGQALTGKEEKE